MKCVFLDIDGVLLPIRKLKDDEPAIQVSDSYEKFPEYTLIALSKILEETGATVVLSSSWRSSESAVQQILDTFAAFGKKHGGPLANLKAFAATTDIKKHHVRKWEVVEWILASRSNGVEIENWVALDDDNSFEHGKKYAEEVEGHFVKCDSQKALTLERANVAIAILNT